MLDFRANKEFEDRRAYSLVDNHQIFQPRKTVRAHLRISAEAHLRKKYGPGLYKKQSEITAILNHLFDFYHNKPSCLEFVLKQYDKAGDIFSKYKSFSLQKERSNTHLEP